MITKKQRYFIRLNNCRSFFLTNGSPIKLKWNRVPFNGAQVDLENVNPSCGEEEFSKDLAGLCELQLHDLVTNFACVLHNCILIFVNFY